MRRLLVLLKNILSIPYRIISHISILSILQEAVVDKTAAICSGVRFYRSSLGRYSYIGNNSFISDAKIGNFVSISTDCYIGGASHPLDWISTSPVFHKWDNIMKTNFSDKEFDIFHKTIIGNDVWIGNRVMIKSGVKIGNGSVIGMGSVLTKDVGPYEIWGGNPAKFIRKRFDDDVIEFLELTEWWNLPESDIYALAQYIDDVDQFINYFRERIEGGE